MNIKKILIKKTIIKPILVLFFLLSISINAHAQQVTCKKNVMTDNIYCGSEAEYIENGFYFFGTNDIGTDPRIGFAFGDVRPSIVPDGIMIKLDNETPFRVRAHVEPPEEFCSSGVCMWNVTATAFFSKEDLYRFSNASKMLVSFTSRPYYASEPISVNPKLISFWYREWEEIDYSSLEN